eukprot:TRINITY_DN10607_c0_g1_i1.p1 TRINITY_DN10607_c0_g1~~TRINITY_DN10607_c0_g1_i1.p1  ORF type:complete len:55 (-),score=3.32 TRINITY_DN10607_c0_g1_i1:2-166(-)
MYVPCFHKQISRTFKNFEKPLATLSLKKLTVEFIAHVLCVDTGRSSETAKAHRG